MDEEKNKSQDENENVVWPDYVDNNKPPAGP